MLGIIDPGTTTFLLMENWGVLAENCGGLILAWITLLRSPAGLFCFGAFWFGFIGLRLEEPEQPVHAGDDA